MVKYLNQIFDFMVEIIHEHKGIINKFLGDGFMAVFGAPLSSGNDVENGVKAALAIHKRNQEEIIKGSLPDLKINMGLHYGEGITGKIGTDRRLEYTIIGDVVNAAAHIEQMNKTFSTTILISEEALAKFPEVKARLIDSSTLKHKGQPVKLYKLM